MKIPSQEEFEKLIKPFLEKNNIDPKDCKYVPHAYGFKNDNFRIYKEESKYHLFLLKAYDGEYKKDEDQIFYIPKNTLNFEDDQLFIHVKNLFPTSEFVIKVLYLKDLIQKEEIKELSQIEVLTNIYENHIWKHEEAKLLLLIIKHSENGLKF